MPRKRLHSNDPLFKFRNMLEAQGLPAQAGRARLGAAGRGRFGGITPSAIVSPEPAAGTTVETGQAAISNTSTFVSVIHGLGVVPAAGAIMVAPANDTAAAADWWLSNFTSTTFRINVSAAPGSGNTALFDWQGHAIASAGPSGDPAILDTAAMWFRASDIAAADGAAVSSWPDRTVHARNLDQPTAAVQPVYWSTTAAGLIGGEPTVEFTSDWFNGPVDLDFSAGFTAAMVVQPRSTATALLMSIYNATNQARMQVISGGGVLTGRMLQTNGIYIGRSTGGVFPNTTSQVLMMTYDGGTSAAGVRIYLGGTQVDNADSNAGVFTGVPASSTKTFELGSQSGGASRFIGLMAEVAVFESGVPVADLNELGGFWADRYGLTWTDIP